jgi:hypothetical protein
MKVINLFSGPGVGKSTLAAGLFYEMKCQRLEVELVQEYAKDLVWEQRLNMLSDQLYVFAKQQRRIRRLQDHKLDWVVTDSPIPMGLVYLQPGALSENFSELVWDVFNEFDNINFFITRNVEYSPVGRSQTLTQAQELDQKILHLLENREVNFTTVKGGEGSIPTIMDHLGLAK